MAVGRLKIWGVETLTDTDLNAEFNNIINNGLSVAFPATANVDFGGFRIITLNAGTLGDPAIQPTGDTNTGVYFPAANTVGVVTDGIQAASLGASFVLRAAPEDARTNTIDVAGIIESTTSGVPAAGIGVGLQFNCESADENPSVFGRIDFAATDIGAASEDTYMDVLLRVAGVAAETKWRLASTAGTGFRVDLTHAATANRVVTIQDAAAQTLVARDTTDTLTNKTLTSPTLTTAVVSGAAPATPVANVLYSDSVVKGWVRFNGTGVIAIDDDLNVSSLTDNGVGNYTVNWATSFATANYGISAMGSQRHTNVTAMAAGNFTIECTDSANALVDTALIMAIAIGDQ